MRKPISPLFTTEYTMKKIINVMMAHSQSMKAKSVASSKNTVGGQDK